MSVFPLLVIVHGLAATVWTGGHLVLDLGVLPRALRAQSAAQIRSFEEVFEPLGLTALAIQVLTGLCQPTPLRGLAGGRRDHPALGFPSWAPISRHS